MRNPSRVCQAALSLLLLALTSCAQQTVERPLASPSAINPVPTATVSQPPTPLDALDRTGHIAYLTNVFEFGTRDRIKLINVSDASERPLAIDCYICYSISWSSDGQFIAYSGAVTPPTGHSEVFTIDVTTGVIKQVTKSHEPKYGGSLSPDGKRAVLDVADPQSGDAELGILDMTSGSVTKFTATRGLEHEPAWSPDGEHLAYVNNQEETHNIWTMDTDGKNAGQILKLSVGGQITWSPDSTMIAATSPIECGSLYLVEVPNRVATRLTSLDGCASNPVWSPNGQTIAFVNKLYGNATDGSPVKEWTIFLVSADGKDIQPLLSGSGENDPAPEYLAWSSR
jgi:Tol biopolymer transport system component